MLGTEMGVSMPTGATRVSAAITPTTAEALFIGLAWPPADLPALPVPSAVDKCARDLRLWMMAPRISLLGLEFA